MCGLQLVTHCSRFLHSIRVLYGTPDVPSRSYGSITHAWGTKLLQALRSASEVLFRTDCARARYGDAYAYVYVSICGYLTGFQRGSSGDQAKTRCASCASGARPTQGFRQGACGASALFGVFEGEAIVTSSSP